MDAARSPAVLSAIISAGKMQSQIVSYLRSLFSGHTSAPSNIQRINRRRAEFANLSDDELRAAGFSVMAGEMGENITTCGIDVLGLPTGTRLHIGASAVVEVTGLRNPCDQLDQFQSGLRAAVLGRDDQGNLIRKAGVMGIVLASGEVQAGDPIGIELPQPPYRPLERV